MEVLHFDSEINVSCERAAKALGAEGTLEVLLTSAKFKLAAFEGNLEGDVEFNSAMMGKHAKERSNFVHVAPEVRLLISVAP